MAYLGFQITLPKLNLLSIRELYKHIIVLTFENVANFRKTYPNIFEAEAATASICMSNFNLETTRIPKSRTWLTLERAMSLIL